MTEAPIAADLLISGATLITMNAERQVIEDGALAVAGDRIVAVGKREALARTVQAKEVVDGRRFVATPGFVDAHIHITGDPLTRGFARGGPDDNWGDKLQKWVIPIFKAQTAEDEKLSAQCAALAMIRYGTTTFVEAGTVCHLDAVMEGLDESGVRGRVGEWVEGRAFNPADDQAKVSAAAIAILESEVERYPDRGGDTRLAAWPILVGHSTNSDDVWRAARRLADERGLRVSAHMSPRAGDPEWFLAQYNRRPLEHLADIGVLGESVMLTHLANIDESELDLLVGAGAGAIHCPHAALQGGFGVSRIGLFPEMLDRGVNLMLGTDGVAADILSSGRLMASLFRDARCDQDLMPAAAVLEMATLNAARAMGMAGDIGSLEAGKKADFVLHDTWLPEWGPVFDAPEQLAFSAPPGGVHSVWIDGVRVLEDGRATLLDEDRILADARQAGRAVIARTKLPNRTSWPVI
ncbi:MAG: amidohydrolase family protein [Phenylobacterium sp.]|uniref:amidohydrolase family protein n=1 Tax=Phenylobacterium sp. TaxID=1871053 RepID=UPI0025D0302C|nr:amidohydrolase family protein [Phenylobacterium sp.]MBI1197975.1 amidohydrolase family protein [Phenylobacterium sp.]